MEGKTRYIAIAVIAVLCLIGAAVDLVPAYESPEFLTLLGFSAIGWPAIGLTLYIFTDIAYLLIQPTGMPMPWVRIDRDGKTKR